MEDSVKAFIVWVLVLGMVSIYSELFAITISILLLSVHMWKLTVIISRNGE